MTFDWTGKRVAVIGNGSSGVQIFPEIQKRMDGSNFSEELLLASRNAANCLSEGARELFHFIRGPTWIVPSRVQVLSASKAKHVMEQIELDDDERFTPAQIEKFKSDPEFYKKFVKAIEEQVNSNFFIVSRPLLCFDT